MIQSIHIKNYQSHRDTFLEFDEGVNVLIGESDAGKSAIFRAIQWCLYNRPLGSGFRTSGARGDTSVTLKFTDGNELVRVVGPKENVYIVNGQELRAFGQNPPEEVLALHKMDRVLNVQAQIDQIFLLQSSPGAVAKYFNEMADLTKIDKTNKGIDSKSRQIKGDVTLARRSIEKSEAIVDGLSERLKILDPLVEELQGFQDERDEMLKEQKAVQQAVSELENTADRKARLSQRIVPEELMASMSDATIKKEGITTTQKQLAAIVDDLQDVQKKIKRIRSEIVPDDLIKQLDDLFDEGMDLRKKFDSLDKIVSKFNDINRDRKPLSKQLEDVEFQYQTHMKDTCPLCGRRD